MKRLRENQLSPAPVESDRFVLPNLGSVIFKISITISVLVSLIVTLEIFVKGRDYGVNSLTVAQAKATPLMKYISSRKAYEFLSDDPHILFVDVRDPIEISQSGRPVPIDAIVPVRLQSTKFDPNLGEFSLVDNPDFISHMKNVFDTHGKSKHDMVIITCGSGYRSAEAVHKLVAAGYTNVWHIPDGYAGDEKPGLNTHNAWKLAGLPWTMTSQSTATEVK